MQDLKTSLSSKQYFHADCHHAQWHLEQLLVQHRYPCKFSGHWFLADSFLVLWTSSGLSPVFAVPDYFLWGYIQSKVYKTYPANADDLKQ
jgi:hypothetical protein